jgi:dipeptidyl aminopeptidase/acylaminoacyl peptidase
MSTAPDAPFGTWSSPVTADVLMRGMLGLSNPQVVDGDLYWMESRPAEAGRTTVMRRRADGTVEECVPAPFNVRTRVHEYGGICYAAHDGRLFFSHFADGRIHASTLDSSALPRPLTADDGRRFADFCVDAARGRLIAVAEEDVPGDQPRAFLAAVDLDDGTVTELASGHDFFAGPRLAPDGRRLCWIDWDHPRMPWDGTTLREAALDADGSVAAIDRIAGGPEESVFQPGWLPDGRLVFVSDRTGWWNLYVAEGNGVRALLPSPNDFGLPLWQFGMRTWAARDDGHVACTWQASGGDHLGLLDPDTGALHEFDLPWTGIDFLVTDGDHLAFVGSSPRRFPELVRLDPHTDAAEVLRRSSDLALDTEDIARPEAVTYPTGPDGAVEAHAFFYPPTHRSCRGAAGEKPPLIVIGHGGPTAATSPTLNLKVQYWTSRGFAVLDVNYRGSTGHGRAYRDALKGAWGVADVEDVVAGARFLARRGDVDPERLAIRGGSAGGLTVLNALIHHDVFRAGASLYGVADLTRLAEDTHKFESRYLDSLIGPWPEAREVYEARSPVNHADGLDAPMIFLQGLDDRVVPPSQSEAMVEALDRKGVPVAYLAFEGEQHGFRQAANIRRALEAELGFYGRIFGFTPADDVEPIEIRNLD